MADNFIIKLKGFINRTPRLTVDKSISTRSSQPSSYYSGGYGFVEAQREHAQIFEQVIRDYKEKNKAISTAPEGSVKFLMAPNFGLYAAMYGTVASVASNVNFLSNALPAWHIRDWSTTKDGKGEINRLVTIEIERRWGLNNLIKKAVKQRSLYGIAVYAKFVDSKGNILFKLLPASELVNFIVSQDTWEVIEFSWYDGKVFTYKSIRAFDEKGDRNFYIGREEDSDDQVFGTPKLRAMHTQLDMKLRDIENYQLWLKNASRPGVIAIVPDIDSEGLISDLDSAFRALRDADSMHKPQIVKGIGVVGDQVAEKVRFTTIKQEIENRLSIDEQREIDDQVKDSLGIPRAIFGFKQSGGMGSNEYESAMLAFKEFCLDDLTAQVKGDLDKFALPQMLQILEQENWYKKTGIKVNGRFAKASDFHFEFSEVRVEQPSVIAKRELETQKAFLQLYFNGGVTGTEAREIMGLDRETKTDFDFTIYQSQMVKEYTDSTGKIKVNEATDVDDPSTKNPNSDQVEPASEETKDNSTEDSTETIKNILAEKSFKFTAGKTIKKARALYSTDLGSDYSIVPNALALDDAKSLQKKIRDSILKQTHSIDIEKILKKIDLNKFKKIQKSLSPSDSDFKQKLTEIVNESIDPLDDHLIVEELVAAMIIYSRLGQEEAARQASNAGVEPLTPAQIASIRSQVINWVDKRTQNLMGLAEGTATGDITNPLYKGSLDETSKKEIVAVLLAILLSTEDYSKENILAIFNQKMAERANDRATLITENNLAMAFGLGMFLAGRELGARTKTWLRTVSFNPRDEHLALVGETVEYNKPFSNGDMWTNIEPNCKCSVKLGWV